MNQVKGFKFHIVTNVFKGIGQIMLQENSLTGLFFTLGIFLGSVSMGVAVLFAALTGTLTAKILKYDQKEISKGLYGFSPALVGVALIFLFKNEVLIWICIFLGSISAAMLQHFFIKRKIAVFTFPFILVTWVFVTLLHQFTHIAPSDAFMSVPDLSDIDNFTSETNGFGEVIFQSSIWAGLLFFIGVYINSPIAALYGLLGSAISSALSFHGHEPINEIHMGLFSFNAVLCAIVFAGNKKIDGILVLLSVLICVAINIGLVNAKIEILQNAGGAFTLPFVIAAYLVSHLQKRKDKLQTRLKKYLIS
ncbi:urea transporter [Flavobacterium araucananum]|uniref:Urea transporter n=1 Tax=Flavobacterium araucananum TaxID=946678 RepID=A0A227NV40_9FLAO|nr:urea transporter [Flavobacterium araucananum]OXG01587.1 urea transporter [Flavobacterium araucananum]PWJ98976.1 urea transporter [Flavobacterium araucananum]